MSRITAMQKTVVLASASPRRRQLLAQLGIESRVFPVDIDERVLPGEAATDYVSRLARSKATTAVSRLPAEGPSGPLVIGSDTCVEIGGEILGKPVDSAHARAILAKLSGNVHHVHTAVCLLHEQQCWCVTSSSDVVFMTMSPALIERYVDTGEPEGKAGAYAIQGLAARFVKRIDGSYSAIMGLPLHETAELLQKAGLDVLSIQGNSGSPWRE